MIIAIDGTAGSGKSTVARKIAKRLGIIHLNSGALFRAVTYLAIEKKIPLEQEAAITNLAKSLEFKFVLKQPSSETIFIVDGKDLSSEIVTEEIGRLTSKIVSVYPSLRQVLLEEQRKIAQGNSIVVEGRDSGTVVFPNADLKLFLDASLDIRAKRRFAELADAEKMNFEDLKKQIEKRDHQDSSRQVAPLEKAVDADLIDTSSLNPEEVVEQIVQLIQKKGLPVK